MLLVHLMKSTHGLTKNLFLIRHYLLCHIPTIPLNLFQIQWLLNLHSSLGC